MTGNNVYFFLCSLAPGSHPGLAPGPDNKYGIRLDPWTQGSGSGARGQGLDEIADKIPERNSGMKYGHSNPGNGQFSSLSSPRK